MENNCLGFFFSNSRHSFFDGFCLRHARSRYVGVEAVFFNLGVIRIIIASYEQLLLESCSCGLLHTHKILFMKLNVFIRSSSWNQCHSTCKVVHKTTYFLHAASKIWTGGEISHAIRLRIETSVQTFPLHKIDIKNQICVIWILYCFGSVIKRVLF